MTNDNFNEKLEKVIKNLPEFEPESIAWEQIEAQLVFEEKVDDELINLPEFDFNRNSWEKIETKLNHPKNIVKKIVIYSMSAAAAIALVLGISGIFNRNKDVKVTYSTEQIATEEISEKNEKIESDALEYLELSCMAKTEVCNSPEFKDQKAALLELEKERKKITETIHAYGESPELIKSLIKIENLKSEILKDLIKTLNS